MGWSSVGTAGTPSVPRAAGKDDGAGGGEEHVVDLHDREALGPQREPVAPRRVEADAAPQLGGGGGVEGVGFHGGRG